MPETKEGKLIGRVTHYFDKIKVAVIELAGPLKVGDTIRIVGGESTDFEQEVGSMEAEHEKIKKAKKSQVILLDPAGRQFSQKMAEKFSQLDQLIFICGRYEGVDARVNKFIDQKISIGPYVLSGGELPALTIVEAVTRLIPGVLGNKESLLEETFSNNSFKIQSRGRGTKFKINYEYPQYTRPEIFAYQEKGKKKKLSVPRILLSGNHQVIGEWRRKHRK